MGGEAVVAGRQGLAGRSPWPLGQMECLEELLKAGLDRSDIRVESLRELSRSGRTARRRAYFLVTLRSLDSNGAPESFFIKRTPRTDETFTVSEIDKFISSIDVKEFTTPKYYGSLAGVDEDGDFQLSMWEHLSIEQPPTAFSDHYEKVVSAAAAITALTRQVRRAVPGIRPTIQFVRPVAERLLVQFDPAVVQVDRALFEERIAMLASLEGPAITRIERLGGYFSHNDIGNANMLLRPDGPPVILDWENASMGPPGATLRRLVYLTHQQFNEGIKLYIECLNAKHIYPGYEDVWFAVHSIEVFNCLNTQLLSYNTTGKVNVPAVRWALNKVSHLAL